MNEKLINKLLIISIIICIIVLTVYYNWFSIAAYFEPEPPTTVELKDLPINFENATTEQLLNSSIQEILSTGISGGIFMLIGIILVIVLLKSLNLVSINEYQEKSSNETEEDEEYHNECEWCDQEYDEEDSNAEEPNKFCSRTCEKKYREDDED